MFTSDSDLEVAARLERENQAIRAHLGRLIEDEATRTQLIRLIEQIRALAWYPYLRGHEIRIVRPATRWADLVPKGHAELLAGAVACAARGWRVFPVTAARVDDERISESFPMPGETGKRPSITGWPTSATTDPKVIEEWWAEPRNYGANVGIATGPESNLTVIDLDVKHDDSGTVTKDGRVSMLRLEQAHGDLPMGPRPRRGLGLHLYFQYVPELKNSSGLFPGLDVRSAGGYVVAPPSFHRKGGRYHFVPGTEVLPVPEMPMWLIDQLIATTAEKRTKTKERKKPTPVTLPGAASAIAGSYAAVALASEVAAVAAAIEGERNTTLNTAAFSLGQLVGAGALDRHDVVQQLVEAGRVCGLPDDEIDRIVEHALSDGERQPRDLSQIGTRGLGLITKLGLEEII